jgi:RimJ/RimL family protein N-acetyltransferase
MENADTVLIAGKHVVLRDHWPSDVDAFVQMQISGEWRYIDAPWEGNRTAYSEQEERRYRAQFHENLQQDKPIPRKNAVIATIAGQPVVTVNRYNQHNTWAIGIDIFIDKHLNKGLGSDALQLWIDYLFTWSDVHRLGLDTWYFNPRMMHVAEKLGFVYEGKQREMQFWQDLVHFGLLRSEWEKRKHSGDTPTNN